MEQQQQPQQRQQQQQLHSAVVDAIALHKDPRYPREERHKLHVIGYKHVNNYNYTLPPKDRQSLLHLVDFIDYVDSHEVAITELELS
jgi:hypothetical protein